LFGISVAALIPVYSFFILKRKLSIDDSGAIAAAYGSVSAVTFVAAVSFLDIQKVAFSGHMVAVMALMEAPAIIIGVLLIKFYSEKNATSLPESKKDKRKSTKTATIKIVVAAEETIRKILKCDNNSR
jgi:hypothetical protein